jgi:hypothetical protein
MRGNLLLNLQQGSLKISELIRSGNPFLAGRLGSVEASILSKINNFEVEHNLTLLRKRFRLRKQAWFSAGIWPPTNHQMKAFVTEYASALSTASILGEWNDETISNEKIIFQSFSPDSAKIALASFDPIMIAASGNIPWSLDLKGKKVLVISSFANEIELQYQRRENLHKLDVLSDFDLITFMPPQTNGLNISKVGWSRELESAKNKLSDLNSIHHPDIALIAAGAYGMPLSNYLYRQGMQVIYVGGALQLLFGIWGSRWLRSNEILKIATENWIWPGHESKPRGSFLVEKSCYW